MVRRAFLYTLLVLTCAAPAGGAGASIPVSGEWRVRLDPDDAGLANQWYGAALTGERMLLPGSTDERRLGNRNERRELRRLTRAFEFIGPAWYQREITVPEGWKNKRITLFLERCHWETQAWLDDRHLGLQNSLSTPHVFELPAGTQPGTHRLTVRVDNRLKIDLGSYASGVSEEGPSNWNGILGRMELRATDDVWIDSVAVYPDAATRGARAVVSLRNGGGNVASAIVNTTVSGRTPGTLVEVPRTVSVRPPATSVSIDVPLPSAAAWDAFNPAIYDLSVSLTSRAAGSFSDRAAVSFGIRRLAPEGRVLKLNSRPIFLRGTVDNGAFPQTGHPPMDVATWRQRFAIYQEYGINHVRFHSWCPPEAAFAAADELGLLLQIENPMWIGDGRVSADASRIAFIRQEAERIVDTYGNHPSFALMSMGNELGSGLDAFLGSLVQFLQGHDSRRLYTSTSAPDNVLRPDDYFVSAGPRWQNLRGDPRLERNAPDTAFDYREYLAGIDRPVIAHELGQWTVFPNLTEQRKYTGALEPRYFDIYRELMRKAGLADRNAQFTRASGALMTALYKEEIESSLRTPGLAGFQLLGLSDWPGFGPAFTGVLDALNESRGLIPPAEFRRFCNDTVPLLRLPKRVWTDDEILTGTIDVSHYGPKPMEGVVPTWTVRDVKGQTISSGREAAVTFAAGLLENAGKIVVPLRGLGAPARYSIEVQIGGHANDWDFWVYPAQLPPEPRDVLVSKSWDERTRAALREGRSVLLTAFQKTANNTVPASFTTAFWSLVWFPKRTETMGLLCDPGHPALAAFPTEFHSNWQWWELMSQSRAFVLDGAPQELRPVVQVIDDANRSHRLAAIFEVRVGKGKLLVTSLDLEDSPGTRPAARQLRHSLLTYAASDGFQPTMELSMDFLDRLFGSPGT